MIKKNNIGFIRLLFAYLVIISHSPQLIDNNATREYFYLLTGTVDLGALAVNGFFLFSGYLIYQSYKNSSSFFNWLMRRVLRIYPAFIVVWFACVFIVVPLSGATYLLSEYTNVEWIRMMLKVFFLSVPHIDGLYEATGIHTINGSLWTIRYEFLCYMLIPLIALLGMNKRSCFIALFISTAIYLYTKIVSDFGIDTPFSLSAALMSRLACAFLIGVFFNKYKDEIVWSYKLSFACFILLIVSLNSPIFATLGFNLFGGYLLFNFAFNFKNSIIQKINNSYDISYGVYIYAWPIQTLIIQNQPDISPWLLSALSILIASTLGVLSWVFIEKPFLKLKKFIPLKLNMNINKF